MVVLAAAVCTNTGRTILSRQFVEMTRMHIEALLAAFPKLMNTGKQHTFVETDSVRYVYQPLGKLYMVLLTTKNSNILEDLETLGLFSRVIPKYCAVLEESEIAGHCFDLLFAFDEIVALGGYRENVSLAQVLAFTEMDSQEEKVFLAIRETQEREATAERAKKARELEQARRDANRKKMSGFSGGGRVTSVSSASIIEDIIVKSERPKMTPFRPSGWGTSKALKLHPRGKEVDSFVDKLKSEGETVMPAAGRRGSGTTKVLPPPANAESVHLCAKETISLTCCRYGGLKNMEVLGKLTLRVTEGKSQRVRLVVANDSTGFELKANPQMDEKLFKAESVIGLKNPENSFPLNQDVLVLKWRLQTADKSLVPLTINCWPSESVSGCDVIIDYELQQESLRLNDVFISIPVPPGVGAPVIGDLDDGECEHDKRLDVLVWSLPAIDANNKSGSLEFSVDGHPDDFFPINVSFVSKRNYCNIQVTEVNHVDGEAPVRFSSETSFVVDKYEIL